MSDCCFYLGIFHESQQHIISHQRIREVSLVSTLKIAPHHLLHEVKV